MSQLRSRRGGRVAPEPLEQPLLDHEAHETAQVSVRRSAAEQRELPWPLAALAAAAHSLVQALSAAWHFLLGAPLPPLSAVSVLADAKPRVVSS